MNIEGNKIDITIYRKNILLRRKIIMEDRYRKEIYSMFNRYIMTYQVKDEKDTFNIYIQFNGQYSVTHKRKSIKKGKINPKNLVPWLQLFIDEDYTNDYSGGSNDPFKRIRFMDTTETLRVITVTEGLPAPKIVYEFVGLLDMLLSPEFVDDKFNKDSKLITKIKK